MIHMLKAFVTKLCFLYQLLPDCKLYYIELYISISFASSKQMGIFNIFNFKAVFQLILMLGVIIAMTEKMNVNKISNFA